MIKIIDKFLQLLNRRRRAKIWGIPFKRVKNFQIPQSVQLHGKSIDLSIPTEDAGIVSEFIEVILDDCYKLESWQKCLRADATILDIGGNVGLFSLAARQAFPEAGIYSYEPNSSLERYLKHQAKTANFNYFMQALGSNNGKVRLKLSETGASGNTISVIDETGEIPCLALSEAIRNIGKQVDLAKIDCEGAEWDLFKAVDVWDKIQNIAMEYHLFKKGQTLEQLKTIIESLGFEIKMVKPTDQYYGDLIASRQ